MLTTKNVRLTAESDGTARGTATVPPSRLEGIAYRITSPGNATGNIKVMANGGTIYTKSAAVDGDLIYDWDRHAAGYFPPLTPEHIACTIDSFNVGDVVNIKLVLSR